MSHRHEVLIAGGGPVGLCLALALAAAGCSVALQQSKPPPTYTPDSPVDSRVYALAPDVLELLEQVGAWQLASALRSCDYARMEVYEAEARIAFEAAEWGWPRLGAIVEHGVLVHALQCRVAATPGIRLLRGAVLGVHREPEGLVLMTANTTLRAPLLVIAEGADSPLREELGFVMEVHDYAQSAVGSHLSIEGSHGGVARQRFVDGQPLALLPLADGRVSLVWSVPRGAARRLCELDDAAFLGEVQAAFGHALGRFCAAGPRVAAPLLRRHARTYLKPGLALIGDAAHTLHPLAGQGLNLGLRDVGTLATVIADARRRGAPLGAIDTLRAYERRRRSENALALAGVHAIGALFAVPDGPLRSARRLGLEIADRAFPLRSAFARLAAGRWNRPWG
ncbi:MAG: FAD-dependent monooxygenase [Xanthomonadales bacterium]|jgi:2-octaprenyl-3-methyl-6-methoxy-1,4-benzoquinol hydroxylase/2-octaprenylphenol hydroxylase|nr:FAD-dependent monooxygenase [Xanthomonadales bacterium]